MCGIKFYGDEFIADKECHFSLVRKERPAPGTVSCCTRDGFAQHLGRFRGMLAVPRNCHMCISSQVLCPSHVQFIPVCFDCHMCNSMDIANNTDTDPC